MSPWFYSHSSLNINAPRPFFLRHRRPGVLCQRTPLQLLLPAERLLSRVPIPLHQTLGLPLICPIAPLPSQCPLQITACFPDGTVFPCPITGCPWVACVSAAVLPLAARFLMPHLLRSAIRVAQVLWLLYKGRRQSAELCNRASQRGSRLCARGKGNPSWCSAWTRASWSVFGQ